MYFYIYIPLTFYKFPELLKNRRPSSESFTLLQNTMHIWLLYAEQSCLQRFKYKGKIKKFNFSGMAYNFKKQPASNINSLGTPYDIRSMMHYGSTAFGGGRRTIETKDPSKQRLIGQRGGFSDIDIKQINLMYCGGTCYTNLFFP